MIILHYVPSIDRSSGGVGSYMQLLAKPLGRLVELHIATHRGEEPLAIEGAEVHYISSSVFRGMKKEWQQLLDGLHPDVVHINTCWLPMSALAQKIAQKQGYKVMLSPHGMLEPWIISRHYWTKKVPAMLLYQKEAVKRADLLHATAETEKENLLKLGWNHNIQIVPNGVDVEAIEMKTSWERTRKILFLSRVHIKKGINFLIEAAARLRNELNDYEILIAGEGDKAYVEELQQMVVQMGLSSMIRFVGGVYGDTKWQFFREADLFVLPTHSENFGIVVAEALASGTPVVTTTGTPWQELKTRHCGWQIAVGTEPLVQALREFLQTSESELKQMGQNGRELVMQHYSSSVMARKMYEVYQQLI